MKRIYLFMLAALCLLSSCAEEDVISPTQALETRSVISQQQLFSQLSGIPLHIMNADENYKYRYLSARTDDKVDLYNKDDNSLRQRWLINSYGQIFPSGGVNNYQNKYLAGPSSINEPHLLTKASGVTPYLNIFSLHEVEGTDYYTIEANYSSSQYIMKADASGSKVARVLAKPTSSFLALPYKWTIRPVEEFELIEISYTLESQDGIVPIPTFIDECGLNNSRSSIPQQMTAQFSSKATESSTFGETHGISVTAKAGLAFKVPVVNVVSGTLDVSTTTTNTWSYSNTETKEDTRTYTFVLQVPAYANYRAQISVARYNAQATYLAKYRGKTTGRTFTLKGKWSGIKAGLIQYTIYDVNDGNRLVKSLTRTTTGVVEM